MHRMQMQKDAGNLMAGVGDYSILAKLYGLTDEQLALLNAKYGGGSGGGGGGSYRGGGSRGGGSSSDGGSGLTTEELLAWLYGPESTGGSTGSGSKGGGGKLPDPRRNSLN